MVMVTVEEVMVVDDDPHVMHYSFSTRAWFVRFVVHQTLPIIDPTSDV